MPPGRQHRGRLPPRYDAVLPMAPGPCGCGPDDPRPGRLCRLAARAEIEPHEHRPAHRVAEGLFPLLATGRRAGGKPGRTAGQPEAVGAGAEGPLAGPGQPPLRDAEAGRPVLAARSGAAGTALRHRLPGVGAFEPEASRRAPGGRLLHLPRQRRQAADGAAGGQGRRGRAGVSRARTRSAGGAGFARRRSGSCSPIAAAVCGASGSGS